MEKLTEKVGNHYSLAEPYINWTNGVQRGWDKLGLIEEVLDEFCVTNIQDLRRRLENSDKFGELQEKINCPLDFITTPYSLSGLKKVWYHKQWCDVVRVVAYEEATKPYMEIRCKDYKYLKMVLLEDYKNTWWLKEDKSE